MGWSKEKIRLFEIIKPYSSWENEDEEKHQRAKETLYKFYDELKKCKLDKQYMIAENSDLHMSYFHYLVQIKRYFMEQRYTRVCHELGSLIYHEPFFQGRIYNNVLKLLEESLPGLRSEWRR